MGKPKLFSETIATVDIEVTDINDCPPIFSSPIYNVTILLPSYKNVAVIQVSAVDPDSSEGQFLKYDIIEGNKLGRLQGFGKCSPFGSNQSNHSFRCFQNRLANGHNHLSGPGNSEILSFVQAARSRFRRQIFQRSQSLH